MWRAPAEQCCHATCSFSCHAAGKRVMKGPETGVSQSGVIRTLVPGQLSVLERGARRSGEGGGAGEGDFLCCIA